VSAFRFLLRLITGGLIRVTAQLYYLRLARTDTMSISGSSDPAIVGKVIRSELRQTVARNCDGQVNLS